VNYEDLTKRLKEAEKEKNKKYPYSPPKIWWQGYVAALNDIRNDFNTGANP